MSRDVAAIILGAGKGSRMKSNKPKVMMPVCGKPMISHILDTLKKIPIQKVVTVVSPEGKEVVEAVYPFQTCVQKEQLGTGHAVNCAKDLLKDFKGVVLVIFGDTPLITKETFEKSITKVEEGFEVVVLGFRPNDAGRYGRLVMKGEELDRIVEFKDANDEEKKIDFCNSGVMAFDGRYIFQILAQIENKNVAGEFYLTDAVSVAKKMGLKCTALEGKPHEVASANTIEELEQLEKFYKEIKDGKIC